LVDGTHISYFFSAFIFSSPLIVFDVAANDWSKVQPLMRRFLLVQLGGGMERETRVALVMAVEKSTWTEVARMPPDVHAQLAMAEAGRGFECAAHGDFVVLAAKGAAVA
jgi:hypothetical protein